MSNSLISRSEELVPLQLKMRSNLTRVPVARTGLDWGKLRDIQRKSARTTIGLLNIDRMWIVVDTLIICLPMEPLLEIIGLAKGHNKEKQSIKVEMLIIPTGTATLDHQLQTVLALGIIRLKTPEYKTIPPVITCGTLINFRLTVGKGTKRNNIRSTL